MNDVRTPSPPIVILQVKCMHVTLDDRAVSPPDGFLIRKGPGNCYFDFAQEVSFTEPCTPRVAAAPSKPRYVYTTCGGGAHKTQVRVHRVWRRCLKNPGTCALHLVSTPMCRFGFDVAIWPELVIALLMYM